VGLFIASRYESHTVVLLDELRSVHGRDVTTEEYKELASFRPESFGDFLIRLRSFQLQYWSNQLVCSF
jgi:hypothetical protein